MSINIYDIRQDFEIHAKILDKLKVLHEIKQVYPNLHQDSLLEIIDFFEKRSWKILNRIEEKFKDK